MGLDSRSDYFEAHLRYGSYSADILGGNNSAQLFRNQSKQAKLKKINILKIRHVILIQLERVRMVVIEA